jgi:CRISPR-associated protein Csd1
MALEKWDWERGLGIACSLVRGSRWEENYQISLEEDRTTRDYLFGRLFAIAENIETHARYIARESQNTNVARLMQRFADHPCSTWRRMGLALTPCKLLLRAHRPAVLVPRKRLLDSVREMFREKDFLNDSRLSGEFLLGYHCQRAALWDKTRTPAEPEEAKADPAEGGE